MHAALSGPTAQILKVRWHPNRDLLAVAVSWLFVVGALYTASSIVGQQVWGGMAYFLLYGVVGCTLFGVGIPLYWTVAVRNRPVSDLGLTTHYLWRSLGLQLLFALTQLLLMRGAMVFPAWDTLAPLIALALAVGFFEAIFWRGWVVQRLEDAFGLLPAVVLGSMLYALYHIGYGMPASEMLFLFFIGVMFAIVFLLTRSIFILWPLFQPLGQLVTLIRDQLSLPLVAALGFLEVLALMLLLVWLAVRYDRKHRAVSHS